MSLSFKSLIWALAITFAVPYMYAEGSQVEGLGNHIVKVDKNITTVMQTGKDIIDYTEISRGYKAKVYVSISDDMASPPNFTSSGSYEKKIFSSQSLSKSTEEPIDDPNLQWASDKLVYIGYTSGIDFDIDEQTGDLYLIVDLSHSSGNDSMLIYKSTDNGQTWSFWSYVVGEVYDYIYNPKIRVAVDGSGNSQILIMGIWYNSSNGNNELWLHRMYPNGNRISWEMVDDSVIYADLDADIGTGSKAYVVYVPMNTNNDIYAALNSLDGNGWQSNQLLFADPQVSPYPEIAAKGDGNVAVAFIDNRLTTNQEVRVKRSTDYGSSWMGSQQVSNNTGAASLSFTDIALTRGTNTNGWIFVTFDFGGGSVNTGYYYTTDDGATWAYGGIMTPSSGEETRASLRANKNNGDLTVAYKESVGDSVMFTWAPYNSPTSFSSPVKVSDLVATDNFKPVAGWIKVGVTPYSAVAYSQFGGINALFDWFGNTTDVEEKEVTSVTSNIFMSALQTGKNNVNIVFSIPYRTNLSLKAYNSSGRLVSTILEGNYEAGKYSATINKNLKSGIYFLNLRTEKESYRRSFIIVK